MKEKFVSSKDALDSYLWVDPYYGGTVEQTESKLEKVIELLAFITKDWGPEQWNDASGWTRYESREV